MYLPLSLSCEKATFGPTENVPAAAARALSAGATTSIRCPTEISVSSRRRHQIRKNHVASSHGLTNQHRGADDCGRSGVRRRLGPSRVRYDAASGRILWQTRLPTSAQGFPVSYLAKGKQYVAVPAGIGGGSWSTLLAPELAPEIRRPNSGNSILVFALPGGAATGTRSTQ